MAGYSNPYKGDALSEASVIRSAAIGNRIAKQIAERNGGIKADAAIRHAIINPSPGRWNAVQLTMELMGLNYADASAYVHRLATTKADDIVTPHFE